MQTVYERLGGETGITTVVDDFYRRVLADPALKDMFRSTDMEAQRRHQAMFLGMVVGGPLYTGGSLRDAHQGRGLTDEHFNAVAGHLKASLQGAGLGHGEIAAVMALVGGLRSDVVQHH